MIWTQEQIQENRRRWIAELRAGHEQAQGVLVRTDAEGAPVGFCCLGVATLYLGYDGAGRVAEDGYFLEFGEVSSALPDNTRMALGLVTSLPKVVWHGKSVPLHSLNDGFKFSLSEIADVIEAQDESWDGQTYSYPIWMAMDPIPRPSQL
jgi:hypothetical protein